MLSSSTVAERRIANNSGGSTGEPLRFYQDRNVFDQMNAGWMLALSFAGWTPDDMVVSIWGNPREFVRKANHLDALKSWLGGNLALNAYRYNNAIMDMWLKRIGQFRSVFLYGYASVLVDFAQYILERGIRVANIKGVMSSAEKLYDWQREKLEKAFACRVYDQYGCREVPCIASECTCGGMHLLTHSAYVEFEADPEHGGDKVIVTSLTNKTMPFLRYEIGDYATARQGCCSCGRGFPLLQMDIGRCCDTLVSPSGDVIYGTYFVRQMYGIAGVSAFQFRQTSREQLELFVVRGEGFSDASMASLNRIGGIIASDIDPALRISLFLVDAIPRTRGGKHRHVVCEVER